MNVIEIFSSAQGEGKFVGCRQIFIRLADCNLNCAYCDTNFLRTDFCNVETFAGSMEFTKIKNPLDTAQVTEILKNFSQQVPTHSLSFTGGEPLLSWQAILDVATKIKKSCNVKIFLETNGTLCDELKKILDVVDIISMDIKLGVDLFARHKRFLQIASTKEVYVKTVISADTAREEFLQAVDLIAEVSPEILFVLQPVTPIGEVQVASPKKLLEWQALALKKLTDVRIIPQTHRLIGNL